MIIPRIVYEDEGILVVDKPAGIAVLPERWEDEAEDLLTTLRESRPELTTAHRIDKETSGLLLCARIPARARELQILFEKRLVDKRYHAILNGRVGWSEQLCELRLLPDGDRRHRTVVAGDGKTSATHFTVLEKFRSHTLVEARLLTGRTHQIRAHAAALGFPIVSDQLYGGKKLFLSDIKSGYRGDKFEERPLIDRTALHAFSLAFESHRFEAVYPKDFAAALNQLRKSS